ncbi:MAG: hypothetical protein IPO97_10870 [Sphingomonadales bacterium]|nr:hypothetical protein [Sphingomonadales bacterium]
MGGPEALVGDEVAELISQEVGKPVRFLSLEPDDFAGNMSELVTGSRELLPGTPYAGMAKFYRFYNSQAESPLVVDPAEPIELLDVRPMLMREWLKRWDWSKPI